MNANEGTKVDTSIYGLDRPNHYNALVRDLLSTMAPQMDPRRVPSVSATPGDAPPKASRPPMGTKTPSDTAPAPRGASPGPESPPADPDEAAAADPEAVSEARAYLVKTSDPGYTMNRQGVDLSIARLHPAMALKLATAIRTARQAGIPAAIGSAYRPPAYNIGGFKGGVPGKFRSLHSYGLAVDVAGLDGPNGKNTKQWYDIATQAGLYNPYGPKNYAEYNHYQLIPDRVAPAALRATITADGPISLNSMWKAAGIDPGSPEAMAYADPTKDVATPQEQRDSDPFGVQRMKDQAPAVQGSAGLSLPERSFRKGDISTDIIPYQSMLSDLGYYKGVLDGKYGPKTAAAVRHYQKDAGAQQDGVLGIGQRAETGPAIMRDWSSTQGKPQPNPGDTGEVSAGANDFVTPAARPAPAQVVPAPVAPPPSPTRAATPAGPDFSEAADTDLYGQNSELQFETNLRAQAKASPRVAANYRAAGWIPQDQETGIPHPGQNLTATPNQLAGRSSGEGFTDDRPKPVPSVFKAPATAPYEAGDEEQQRKLPPGSPTIPSFDITPNPPAARPQSSLPAGSMNFASDDANDAFSTFFRAQQHENAAEPAPVDPTNDAFSAGFAPAAGTPASPTAPGSNIPGAAEDWSVNPMAVDRTAQAKALQGTTGDDAGQVFSRGLIKGLPVVGPTLDEGAQKAAAYLRSLVKGTDYDRELRLAQMRDKTGSVEHPTADSLGHITGQGLGYGAAVAAAPAAFGIGAASTPAAITASALSSGSIAGMDAVSRGEDPVSAAIAGGTLGMFAPGTGRAMAKTLSSSIAPGVARLADIALNKFNIPLSADLLSTNPMIRFAHSVVEKMPFTGGGGARAARQVAFNRGIAASFGETADHVTPEVIDSAYKRIGGMFDNVANNTPQIGADQQFGADLANTWHEASQVLTDQEMKPLENQITNITQKFVDGNGSITGAQYKTLTSRGSPLDVASKSPNGSIRHYAGQIRDALDGALERHAPQEAIDDLRTARTQYKALKTVEDLAEKAPTGDISPALLLTPVRKSYSNFSRGGGGDLADLARIGQLFLKDAPSSGTSERQVIYEGLGKLGKALEPAALAGGAEMLFHHLPLTAAASTVPFMAGRVANKVLNNPRVVNSLVQNAMRGPGLAARSAPYAVPVAAQSLLQKPLSRAIRDRLDGSGASH